MRRIYIFAALLAAASAGNAWADTGSHCELFAKDVADQRTSDVDQWQKLYRNAYTDCLQQYTATAPVAAAVEKPAKVKRKTSTRKTIQSPTINPLPGTVVVGAKPPSKGLEPGSDAWNDYCAAKYQSFDRSTGNYRSRSGKLRRCAVTGKS